MSRKRVNKEDLVLGGVYLIPTKEHEMIFVHRDENDKIYFYPTSEESYYDKEEDGTIVFSDPAIYEEVE